MIMRPSPLMQNLPRDIAHPRQELASLAANIITALCLLACLGLLLAGWLVTR